MCAGGGSGSGGDAVCGDNHGDDDVAHLIGQQCHGSGSGICFHSQRRCRALPPTSPPLPLQHPAHMHFHHLFQQLMLQKYQNHVRQFHFDCININKHQKLCYPQSS